MIFDLSGLTPTQRAITEEAINRTKFDYDLLIPGLLASKGKTTIPVEWIDLTSFKSTGAASGHQHIHEGGDTAHVLENREQVLGLAWYSGKVSIHSGLESNPLLAQRVFISEGAHMVDFFYMTDAQRYEIAKAYHGGSDPHHADHAWFEERGDNDYFDWPGESFMNGFMQAYSDLKEPVDYFSHKTTPEIAAQIRQILTPIKETPQPAPYFTDREASGIFHDQHRGYPKVIEFADYEEAVSSGRRPCRVCKPRPPINI